MKSNDVLNEMKDFKYWRSSILGPFFFGSDTLLNKNCGVQAQVVQKVDNAIHRVNLYPLDGAMGFANTFPLSFGKWFIQWIALSRSVLNNSGQNFKASKIFLFLFGCSELKSTRLNLKDLLANQSELFITSVVYILKLITYSSVLL